MGIFGRFLSVGLSLWYILGRKFERWKVRNFVREVRVGKWLCVLEFWEDGFCRLRVTLFRESVFVVLRGSVCCIREMGRVFFILGGVRSELNCVIE